MVVPEQLQDKPDQTHRPTYIKWFLCLHKLLIKVLDFNLLRRLTLLFGRVYLSIVCFSSFLSERERNREHPFIVSFLYSSIIITIT